MYERLNLCYVRTYLNYHAYLDTIFVLTEAQASISFQRDPATIQALASICEMLHSDLASINPLFEPGFYSDKYSTIM